MVARMLSLGLALGWSGVVSVGLAPWSAAHAASPVGLAHASHPKRPQFRPWYRTQQRAPLGRWRPQPKAGGRVPAPSRVGRALPSPQGVPFANALLSAERDRYRKAEPVVLGRELGTKFRPPGRASAGEPLLARHIGVAGSEQARLHAQFRPTRAKRRLTYEQLQARATRYRPGTAAGGSYASSAAPLRTAYHGYWPVWPM